jgi:hypothetical protein
MMEYWNNVKEKKTNLPAIARDLPAIAKDASI